MQGGTDGRGIRELVANPGYGALLALIARVPMLQLLPLSINYEKEFAEGATIGRLEVDSKYPLEPFFCLSKIDLLILIPTKFLKLKRRK